MPKSYPVTITSSPLFNLSHDDSITVPAASIPGTKGYSLVTPLLPDAERASL